MGGQAVAANLEIDAAREAGDSHGTVVVAAEGTDATDQAGEGAARDFYTVADGDAAASDEAEKGEGGPGEEGGGFWDCWGGVSQNKVGQVRVIRPKALDSHACDWRIRNDANKCQVGLVAGMGDYNVAGGKGE